jgi:hypothetical protein
MHPSFKIRFTIASLILSLCFIEMVGAAQAQTLFGQVTDPSGDAGIPPPPAVPPDLISASVTVSNGSMNLGVRFAPGAFNSETTFVVFSLDTDQNPSTGHPGLDEFGTIDAGIIGSDFLVTLGSAFNAGRAQVLKYVGPPINTFAFVASFPVTFSQDGMDVTVPLSAIGSDDGLLNFKVVSVVQIAPNGFTGILDVMPNVGLPAGSTSGLITFDICLRDDSNGNLLQLDSNTGNYQFTNCSGFAIGGTGAIAKKGGVVTLQDNSGDRRVLARIDKGVNRGTVSVQILSVGITFSIIDRDTKNSACTCF